jgi:hypothetical protein
MRAPNSRNKCRNIIGYSGTNVNVVQALDSAKRGERPG